MLGGGDEIWDRSVNPGGKTAVGVGKDDTTWRVKPYSVDNVYTYFLNRNPHNFKNILD